MGVPAHFLHIYLSIRGPLEQGFLDRSNDCLWLFDHDSPTLGVFLLRKADRQQAVLVRGGRFSLLDKGR